MAGMTLSTTNVASVQGTLRKYGQVAVLRAKDVVRRSLERQHTESLSLCPYDRSEADDFHMIEYLHGTLSEDGLGYEVGFEESDFAAAGQDFYPLYVIFGTSKMPARDFLFGPAQVERPRFKRELEAAIAPQARGVQPTRRGR